MSALLIIIIAAFIVVTTSGFAVARIVGRRARLEGDDAMLAPVSVLKPLCGADDALEDNLRTFFEQDHPHFELVFGVTDPEDPAVDIVERLAGQYPAVPCQLVVHDGLRAINPKVANLRGMLDAVQHDIVVISDSNVAAGPHYVREMATKLAVPNVELVSNLFAGTREQTVGATLDNLHLNGQMAAAVALSHLVGGPPIVVGKSMMFRRSIFESIGGFESIATVLAEDYIMGRMFAAAGYDVAVCSHVLENVNQDVDVKGFWNRHLRWSMLRTRLKPSLYALEPLTLPIVWAALAIAAGAPAFAAIAIGIGATMLRDATLWLLLRGPAGLLRALPLSPVKDVLILGIWCTAPLRRHVTWRGNKVRLSSGTRLYASAGVQRA